MNRSDKSKYVLYIEPPATEKLDFPVVDALTSVMEYALAHSITGVARYSDLDDSGTFDEGNGWRGSHRTECGEVSTNHDYLLQNGMITNSLAPFYLRYYRHSIPQTEIDKVQELLTFYIRNGFQ